MVYSLHKRAGVPYFPFVSLFLHVFDSGDSRMLCGIMQSGSALCSVAVRS